VNVHICKYEIVDYSLLPLFFSSSGGRLDEEKKEQHHRYFIHFHLRKAAASKEQSRVDKIARLPIASAKLGNRKRPLLIIRSSRTNPG
jgi:hypothetical protein